MRIYGPTIQDKMRIPNEIKSKTFDNTSMYRKCLKLLRKVAANEIKFHPTFYKSSKLLEESVVTFAISFKRQ